jgi:hypothetical protein
MTRPHTSIASFPNIIRFPQFIFWNKNVFLVPNPLLFLGFIPDCTRFLFEQGNLARHIMRFWWYTLFTRLWYCAYDFLKVQNCFLLVVMTGCLVSVILPWYFYCTSKFICWASSFKWNSQFLSSFLNLIAAMYNAVFSRQGKKKSGETLCSRIDLEDGPVSLLIWHVHWHDRSKKNNMIHFSVYFCYLFFVA